MISPLWCLAFWVGGGKGALVTGTEWGHAATLRDYLHVVRRRKWIILQAVVLVPAAAIAFSLHQQKLYQASAQVLLSSQNLAAELTGTQNTGVSRRPTGSRRRRPTSPACRLSPRSSRRFPAPG